MNWTPSAEACGEAARWLVAARAAHADRRQPTARALLAACAVRWPHEHEPTDADVVLILAAWWDLHRAARLRPPGRGNPLPVYRHEGRVISLPVRSAA